MADVWRRWSCPPWLGRPESDELSLWSAAGTAYVHNGQYFLTGALDGGGHMGFWNVVGTSSEPPFETLSIHQPQQNPQGDSHSQISLSSAGATIHTSTDPPSESPTACEEPLAVDSKASDSNTMAPVSGRGDGRIPPYAFGLGDQAQNGDGNADRPRDNHTGNPSFNAMGQPQGTTMHQAYPHGSQTSLNPEAMAYPHPCYGIANARPMMGPMMGPAGYVGYPPGNPGPFPMYQLPKATASEEANHGYFPAGVFPSAQYPLHGLSLNGSGYQVPTDNAPSTAFQPSQYLETGVRPTTSHVHEWHHDEIRSTDNATPKATEPRRPNAADKLSDYMARALAATDASEYMACAHAVVGDGGKYSSPPKWGVLKIENIPYSVTKEEVICLLGRNAKILPSELGCAVHIIMERSTAKTMDCFVEFVTQADAAEALRYVNGGIPGNPPRLGSRHVQVEMSSQDELLKAMFPRAKCVEWRQGVPHVLENKDPYSTGFQGFFTSEEIYNVIRHAEFPKRAPFAEKCPQRTYENIISTLYKFPWYATSLYTIEDRNTLFTACRRQLAHLEKIIKKKRTLGLDSRLLNDLFQAGLRCPIFNERQRCSLHLAAKNPGIKDMPLSSKCWPFDTLVRKPGSEEAAVTKFASFMAQSSQIFSAGTDTLENKWNEKEHSVSNRMFGEVWLEWGWGNTNHKWDIAVKHEMQIIQNLANALAKADVEAHNARP